MKTTIITAAALFSFLFTGCEAEVSVNTKPSKQVTVTHFISGDMFKTYKAEGLCFMSSADRVDFTDVETGKAMVLIGGAIVIEE